MKKKTNKQIRDAAIAASFERKKIGSGGKFYSMTTEETARAAENWESLGKGVFMRRRLIHD